MSFGLFDPAFRPCMPSEMWKSTLERADALYNTRSTPKGPGLASVFSELGPTVRLLRRAGVPGAPVCGIGELYDFRPLSLSRAETATA